MLPRGVCPYRCVSGLQLLTLDHHVPQPTNSFQSPIPHLLPSAIFHLNSFLPIRTRRRFAVDKFQFLNRVSLIILYNVCSVAERETHKTPCNTKDKLKAKITAVFTSLNKQTVRKVCRFLSCLGNVISLNEFNLYYFKTFACNFNQYTW